MASSTVLVVDPNLPRGRKLGRLLVESGLEASVQTNLEEASALLSLGGVQAVVLDLEVDGAVDWLRAYDLPVLISTEPPVTPLLSEALSQGADDFFVRPIDQAELIRRVERLLCPAEPLPTDLSEILPEVARARLVRVGESFSHYRLLAVLGEGYWGKVYRAFDGRLLREVALKVLKADNPPDADADKLLREARLVAQIDHKGVTRVYEVGFQPSRYIAMELVAGRSLQELVGPDLPCARVRDWMVELLEALQAVHERGIIHRDVKPSNVLLTPDGHIKLMDFGLAGRPSLQPNSLELYGTPVYASPEHFDRRHGPITVRSDLFAVAAMLYELLTGFLPFSGQNFVELAYAIIKETPPSLQSLRPDIPGPLAMICFKGLCKRPEDRYPDALTFARVLRECKL